MDAVKMGNTVVVRNLLYKQRGRKEGIRGDS